MDRGANLEGATKGICQGTMAEQLDIDVSLRVSQNFGKP